MACPSCRNLDPNFAKPTSRENHWKTGFSALCTTAEQGCESCELLRDGILKVQSIPSDLAAEYMLTFRPHMAWYQEDFSKRIDGLAVEIGKSDGVCLNFHTDDDKVWNRFPALSFFPPVDCGPTSEEGITQARRWMSECAESHADCPNGMRPLPTRVIAVGSLSTPSDLRIFEPRPGELGEYVALSYCWGKGRTLLTTQATLKELKAGFLLEDLPKTCQDAVVFARQLGVKFLWIDQLCIIQDSVADWERESSKMCAVYENATVTLAGVDSPDSDTGLFVTYVGSQGVRVDCSTGPVYVRLSGNQNARPVPPNLKANVLHTRGWTLQEVRLSPRLLAFTGNGLKWRCYGAVTEHPKSGQRRHSGSTRDYQLLSTRFQRSGYNVNGWQSLVKIFTARLLTNTGDRLPAISGLAAYWHRHLGYRYLCGIWDTDLTEQLLWYSESRAIYGITSPRMNPANKMRKNYAPSWTWASVYGAVDWRHAYRNRWLYSATCQQYNPVSENIFGTGSGTLQLEGFVVNLEEERTGYLSAVMPPATERKSFSFVLAESNGMNVHRSWMEDFPDHYFRYVLDHREDTNSAANLVLLFTETFEENKRKPDAARVSKGHSGKRSFWIVNGLILKEVSTDDAKALKTYRRLGYAEMCLERLEEKYRSNFHGHHEEQNAQGVEESTIWETLEEKRTIFLI